MRNPYMPSAPPSPRIPWRVILLALCSYLLLGWIGAAAIVPGFMIWASLRD